MISCAPFVKLHIFPTQVRGKRGPGLCFSPEKVSRKLKRSFAKFLTLKRQPLPISPQSSYQSFIQQSQACRSVSPVNSDQDTWVGRNSLMPMGEKKLRKKAHVSSRCPKRQHYTASACVSFLHSASRGPLLWWYSPQKTCARKSSFNTPTVIHSSQTGTYSLTRNSIYKVDEKRPIFFP